MNTFDQTVHAVGLGLLISLGLLLLWMENKCLKQRILKLLVLVLGVLFADVVIHILPNALAGFIYGTH